MRDNPRHKIVSDGVDIAWTFEPPKDLPNRMHVYSRTLKLRQPLGRGAEKGARPSGECGRDSCCGAGTCSQEL